MTTADPEPTRAPPLLPEVFDRVARRHAERVAIEVPPGRGRPERIRWTYAELARASETVAAALRPVAKPESIVAILLPRESPWLVAAQIGILKAGAAWTCLDPAFPADHVRFLLEDAAPVAVVADAAGRAHPGLLDWHGGPLLDPHALPPAPPQSPPPRSPLQSPPQSPPQPPPQPEGLAYVIYTSGTTGRQKGVLVEHRGIASLVASDAETFGLGPQDRVAQNSSAAYDSSIEETWLALAVGATLVILDDDTVRLGPDLVPWLCAERITVFCPPPTLLRTTGCEDPRSALPDLRFVYVGGEALPPDVVERWAPGRWLENGYGPTEGTVTSLRTRIRPGEPITIGRPVPGTRAHVLDERLEEVAEGEPGELCLAGVGLARGYLKRPELTAERFPVHARLGRLYRTGDLVRRDPAGDHHYLGRIDDQVKLRGHRVELGEIEAALAACPGVRAAACRVQGEGAAQGLAAYVVAEDPARPPDFTTLEAALSRRLPAHMVPARYALLGALPTNRSGKLDRTALPHVEAPARGAARPHVAPRDGVEAKIAATCRDVLRLATGSGGGEVSVEDDFFLDLGGTSLSAAVLVSALREDPATAALTVRDVYEARTVAGMAVRARAPAGEDASHQNASEPRGNAGLATAVQGLWLFASLLGSSALLYAAWFLVLPFLLHEVGLAETLLLGPVLGFALLAVWTPFSVALLVVAKRLLIGRYRPMRAPVWGGFYVRHWIVGRVSHFVPWSLLEDTEFAAVVLRALGARIGRRVHIHGSVGVREGGYDLLEIGDDATIGKDATLRLVEVEDGQLVVGPVTVGPRATLDVRASAGPGSVLEAESYLAPLSWLPPGSRVRAGERWDGIPAGPAGRAPEAPAVPPGARTLSPATHGILTLVARLGGRLAHTWLSFAALALALAAAFRVDGDRVAGWLAEPSSAAGAVVALLGIVALSIPLSTVLAALGARMLGPVPEGVVSRWSAAYLRIVAKTDAVRAAETLLSGTLFWPPWLRLAGMRIGRKCEISSILDVVPERVEIGRETFLADGIYLGGPRIHRGTVTVATTRLGDSNFLGNHVVVPAGTKLPDDVLLGVSTVAEARLVRPGTSWFGHPAFALPRREVVEMDRRLTHDPGVLRYATRLTWETARLLIPLGNTVVLFGWLAVVSWAQSALLPTAWRLAAVPAATLASALVLCGVVLAMKWALLGRVKPGQHPLWSCWCSRWDFHYVAWQMYAARILANLEGTLFLTAYLRLMGCRIGRRVVLGGGFAHVVDPDMLHLEDGATVSAMFQAHSFEDRVLKIDHVFVRRHATVASDAVLLYGADVGERAFVAPHSVVMKRERLLPGRAYAGAPAAAMARSGKQ